MIRTTVVGSWPVEERFFPELDRYHRGELAAADADALLRRVAQVAIDQQRACGLDEYTGGETAADTFILHFPRPLTGVEPTEDREAWGGRGAYRVVGPLAAPQGLGIAAAFAREHTLDPQISKVTLPGPSEITMRIEPEAQRRTLWPTVIEIMRQEMAHCIALGARDIQLDLPHVAMGLADGIWDWTPAAAADLIGAVFAGFQDIRRSVHFCYGDFDARTWTDNHAFQPLVSTIQALDGTVDRVVLEFSLPEQWAQRELLPHLPAGMEIAAGIVDVKSPRVQNADELAVRIRTLRALIPPDRLLICPSCGFGRRTPDLAMAKTRAMVAAVRAVNQTPG